METSDKNRDNELELVRGIYEELFHYYHYYVMIFTGTYRVNSWQFIFFLFLILLIIAVVWKVISMPVFQKKKLCFKKC